MLFIVLDGLDELDKESTASVVHIIGQVRDLAVEISRATVRLFITGTPEVLDPLRSWVKPALHELNLEPPESKYARPLHNNDILLFTKNRLDRTECFKKADWMLRQRITSDLVEGARGDYSQLRWLLEDMKEVHNTTDVEDILKRANESRSEVIASKIETLNRTLDKSEIRDLNDMLMWSTTAFQDLKLDQYEAILSLRGDPESTVYLEKRVRERYQVLFNLDENDYVRLRTGVKEHLLNTRESSSSETQVATSMQAFEECEVALVSKVLRTHFRNVSEMMMYTCGSDSTSSSRESWARMQCEYVSMNTSPTSNLLEGVS